MPPAFASAPVSGRVAPIRTRAGPAAVGCATSVFLSLQASATRSGSAAEKTRRFWFISGAFLSGGLTSAVLKYRASNPPGCQQSGGADLSRRMWNWRRRDFPCERSPPRRPAADRTPAAENFALSFRRRPACYAHASHLLSAREDQGPVAGERPRDRARDHPRRGVPARDATPGVAGGRAGREAARRARARHPQQDAGDRARAGGRAAAALCGRVLAW